MQLADALKWEKYKKSNVDEFGRSIIRFSEDWAELMECEIEQNGRKISEIAGETRRKINNGMNGLSYSCAIKILFDTWKYGKQLRRWHIMCLKRGGRDECGTTEEDNQ